MSTPGPQPISSTDDMAKEGTYEWDLEAYAMALENELFIKDFNVLNPSQQKPVPPRPPRPVVPPRPTPRPVPERPPFVDPWV